jgi:D-alanyl-D-alanine endopeptidase (penicillin-binding protein 7)
MKAKLLIACLLLSSSVAFAAQPAHKKYTQKKASKPVAVKTAHLSKKKTYRIAKPAEDFSGPLRLGSSMAIIVDQASGETIFSRNSDSRAPIASITKLMTAMVVLDSNPDMNEAIMVTDDDVDYVKHSSSRLKVGSVLTRQELLLLALMSSENRAASALSRAYPGGTNHFVAAMNRKAVELGMTQSRFVDPTGLQSNNVSTAEDLVKLVRAGYRYDDIRNTSTTDAYDVVYDNGHRTAYRNTNALIKSPEWDIGLSKTGYISEAGRCLVMQARIASRPVIIVLLDSAGKLTRIADAVRIKKWLEISRINGHRVG